jgi:hypothetical protein
MRKKQTVTRTRKQKQASDSPKPTGLIARDPDRRHSAETKSTLDNRSHRTIGLIERLRGLRTSEADRQGGAGGSTPFPGYPFHRLRGRRAQARRA